MRCVQGILYEDTFLQVGLQSRCAGGSVELRLFLGNKQATVQLGSLGLSLTQAVPELAVTVGQVPAALSPKQQVQVGHQGCSIDVDCVCLCAEKGEMWPACACTL